MIASITHSSSVNAKPNGSCPSARVRALVAGPLSTAFAVAGASMMGVGTYLVLFAGGDEGSPGRRAWERSSVRAGWACACRGFR